MLFGTHYRWGLTREQIDAVELPNRAEPRGKEREKENETQNKKARLRHLKDMLVYMENMLLELREVNPIVSYISVIISRGISISTLVANIILSLPLSCFFFFIILYYTIDTSSGTTIRCSKEQ